ncbi:MAG: hemolysin family protein [Lachnospiraceae bacterium]|jgi:putative hemolysin
MEDGSSSPLWACVVFIIFILITRVLYGFGAAIQKLNGQELEKKAQEGDQKSVFIMQIVKKPDVYISSVHVISTLLAVLVGAYGVSRIFYFMNVWLAQIGISLYTDIKGQILYLGAVVLLLILAVVMLQAFGIQSAKVLCSCRPEKYVYRYARLVYILMKLFRPLTYLVSKLTHVIIRMNGIDPLRLGDDVTEEEIISMVDEAHEQGVIEESEAEMIQNIIEFSDKDAKDIMTHRKNIAALDEELTLDEAIHIMLEENNSRYPVYMEDIDNIRGIIHLKDVMQQMILQHNENVPIKDIPGLVRTVSFIPETRGIDDIFKAMQMKKMHMAIVVDEYGQTSGLLTMEDILEEIVGNILDEYDEDDDFIQEQYDDTLLMDGFTPLEQVGEILNINFDDEEFETLNGFLTYRLGHIPTSADAQVEACGYCFLILSIENNTIQKVRVEKILEKEGEGLCQDIPNLQT